MSALCMSRNRQTGDERRDECGPRGRRKEGCRSLMRGGCWLDGRKECLGSVFYLRLKRLDVLGIEVAVKRNR